MEKIEILEFCKHWLPAWTGNQPEKLVQFYSDDCYYQDPAHPEGIKSKEKLLNYFRKLLAKYPNWIWNVAEVFPYEDGFILKWQAKINNMPQAIGFFGLDIVAIKDNKITRNEVYFNPAVL